MNFLSLFVVMLYIPVNIFSVMSRRYPVYFFEEGQLKACHCFCEFMLFEPVNLLFQFEWPEVEKGTDVKETQMIYKFDYLPAGLFNRGQVSL